MEYLCIPQFYCIKVGIKGYSLHGHVFLMDGDAREVVKFVKSPQQD